MSSSTKEALQVGPRSVCFLKTCTMAGSEAEMLWIDMKPKPGRVMYFVIEGIHETRRSRVSPS